MSFAYLEGECFCKRSALRSSAYDPDKPEHFYGHLLYGNWTNIHFLYGKKPFSDEESYRKVDHNLRVSRNRFRDHDKGGALESWFMILPMPLLSKGEEWFLVDASEEYPDVYTFLQVSFAIPRQITVTVHPAVDSADRLSWLVNLLSLPRALRGHNCFSARIIRIFDRKPTPTKADPTPFISDETDLSWTTVASANAGLSIQWKAPQPTTWLAPS
ncbi:hypothetical protein BO82DRAFT_405671 [Aspergillus uvarum CBS 121591]|uniref:Uncharacterized protein n=1 Tax=Aspergillus uvarum CBS 121591 TaxID=1448315 RepID=A0A319BZ14_9EURO|nr:hypothetical protein BO82DRAFT_405671 [Aspergillus uvarum CBS 121591]PYH77975.1 hypothetical protein BO82DRAFT_405671 [Aspergillus uvarum CBS 121591]